MLTGSTVDVESTTATIPESTVSRKKTEVEGLLELSVPTIILSPDPEAEKETSMDDRINEQFADILSAFDARFPPQPITSNPSTSLTLSSNDLSTILSRFDELSSKVERLQRAMDELQKPSRRPMQTPIIDVHYSRSHRGKRQLILEPIATKAKKSEKSS